ncbi:MAG: permease-like cell division protein FtsX [Vulcanimicrobiaceae bacterium]
MDWGRVRFFLGEVFRNFTRNAGMQATAIGTVAVTIVLLGGFLYVRAVLGGVGHDLLQQIRISAYLQQNASNATIAQLHAALLKDPRISSVQFVPKSVGLKELRKETKGVIDLSILTKNPLPDVFRVSVHSASDVPAVAAAVRRMPGVANVVYGKTIVRRLLHLGAVMRRVGIAVIVLFLLVAGIIISSTIRLTVFARRREIAIMQLVGATSAFIRLPFICEGFLDGLLGSLLAVGILAVAHAALWSRVFRALPWLHIDPRLVNTPLFFAQLLLVGAAIGVIASWISVGRYLRT